MDLNSVGQEFSSADFADERRFTDFSLRKSAKSADRFRPVSDFQYMLLQERAVVALFQPHDLLLHHLDLFGQLEERLDDFTFRRLVAERGEQRMKAGHAGGELVASGADLLDGGGSVHGRWRA